MDNFTTSQKVLMGILVIMLAYLGYDLWFGGSSSNEPVQSSTRAVVPSQKKSGSSSGNSGNTAGMGSVKTATASNPWFQNFSHDRWGADPFEHPNYNIQAQTQQTRQQEPVSQVLSSRFRLTAISKRGGDDYVLINNEVLTVGDITDGAELTEIRANSVVMEYRGNKVIVPLSRPQSGQNSN